MDEQPELVMDGPQQPSGLHQELTTEELKTWLERYAEANATLAQKLAACARENRNLRLQNQKLDNQLQRTCKTSDRNHRSSSFPGDGYQEETRSTPYASVFCNEKEIKDATGALPNGPSDLEGFIHAGNRARCSAILDQDTASHVLCALEDASLHMSYCNSERRYVWFSHTLNGLFHEEVVGKRDEDIIFVRSEGLSRFIELKERALETGAIQVGEVTLDWPENERVTWMVTCRPHFNGDGVVVGVSTASIDISEQVEVKKCLRKLHAEMSARKATEDELRRAMHVTENTTQAKNVVLAIMSQEKRTPLNGLLGLAEALESLNLRTEQRELVSTILSSGIIMADILGDIVDLASTEVGALEAEQRSFDPSEIVQDIVKMAVATTRGKDVAIVPEISSHLPPRVVGDVARVRQIMKYLVLNAIKFMQRGTVTIRLTARDAVSSCELDGRSDSSCPASDTGADINAPGSLPVVLFCEVADTGVSVPEAFQPVIEGQTRAFGGTGWGLALCKKLVETVGGELTVISEAHEGSTFAFTVPCKTSDMEPIDQRSGELQHQELYQSESNVDDGMQSPFSMSDGASTSARSPKILLAEDNQVNVMVAISMLNRLGFTAKVVANGVEALEAIRKDKYDLVLLDICMPLMDGLQVARAIRRFEQTGEWPAGVPPSTSTAVPNAVDVKDSEPSPSRRLPIVAVTANSLRTDVERCFAHGVDAFIAKPVMFQKLQEILQRYLPART